MSVNVPDANVGVININSVFTSMSQCSAKTAIPKLVLKRAKALGSPGFSSQSNRIRWAELKPWYDIHKGELEASAEESLEHYKIQLAKRDVVLRDLAIQRERAEALDPKEVKKFLQKLGTVLSSVLKEKRQQLISKCTGYEDLVDREFIAIFDLIAKELSVWK